MRTITRGMSRGFYKQYVPHISAIVTKASKQVPPDSSEANLMFAVFETAARDLVALQRTTYETLSARSARKYINGNMPHLEAIGIEAEWIRSLFKQAGVEHLLKVKEEE